MSELLFESFWSMLLIALVVSGGVAYWAFERRRKNLILAAKIVPICFAFLVGLNLWVVTEREAIREQTDKLIKACEKGDVKTIYAMLDEQFSAQGLTGEYFAETLSDVFDRLSIPNVMLLGVEIKPPTAKIATFAHIVGKGGNDYGSVRSDWLITFINRDTGWYIYELKPLSIQMKPVSDIREVIDSARFVK